MNLEEALAYLDDHVNLERRSPGSAEPARPEIPTLERMRRLVGAMAEPQRQYPVVHLTGTNGKTSTARILTRLLVAKGLSVGTYTSPHLERVNERLAWNGEAVSDGALVELLESMAAVEVMVGTRPSYFEILTAAAFRWFADLAVDVAVVEVGLGGRWDATNVADGQVALVTNVGVDHVEYLGPSRREIAAEKAGIVKPGSILVLGEADPELAPVFRDAMSTETWVRGEAFGCASNLMAHGGRLLGLYTPAGRYDDVFLPLHGAHQGDNAAAALAAAEAFFGSPLHPDLVAEAFAEARSPGRLEVVGRRPLCLLDGVKNVEGALAAAAALDEEFSGVGSRFLVVGLLRGRDPGEMLSALDAPRARLVVACPPPTPRALPPGEVAVAARRLGVAAETAASVGEAVARALALAGPDDLVLVTGSLYVAGAARTALSRGVG